MSAHPFNAPRMRRRIASLLPAALAAVLMLAGCGDTEPRDPEGGETAQLEPGTPAYGVYNLLKASGNRVEAKGSVKQAFFEPAGRVLTVNGAEVQIFEFATREQADAAAGSISPDGATIGSTQVSWAAAPHFYKTDRVILLYVGNDQRTLQALGLALGGQFAGGA